MKKTLTLLFLFLLGLLIYALTIRGQSGNLGAQLIKNNLDQATKPFELSPERGRYILTLSLAENRSVALNNELAEAAYPDTGYYKGKYFILFAPGISLLSIPFYYIGKYFNLAQVGAFSTISLFSAINLVLIFLIAKNIFRLPTVIALFSSLVFGFASTSWSYAITMYQHHLTVFFIISSFYAVWKYRQNQKYNWVWVTYVWIAYGLAISIDYPNALLMFPVMVYFLLSSFIVTNKKKSFQFTIKGVSILTSIIFFVLILIQGYYNYLNFGSFTKVSGALVGAKTVKEQKLLESQKGKEELKKKEEKKSPVGFFREQELPRSFSILFFARDRGLFLYSPIFVIALLGFFSTLKKGALEKKILLSLVFVNVFLYSSWADPWGGWAYGPRYLIPSMATLSIFVGIWLSRIKRHVVIARVLTFFLFAYSSAIALLGALTTNQVPPKIEADYLKMKYNFFLNWDYLMDGKSGSLIFNEYISKYMTLQQYFILIFEFLIITVFVLLFVSSLFKSNNES
ncbi:hypothetical protein HY357_04965 [Candidatus Roizmanbacteria bacterium]|nr:hypothetical protein [Candidatus Roizmanbacteria bacterium]